MADEKAIKKLSGPLDVLIVSTPAISFLGVVSLTFSIVEYFAEHAPHYVLVGDLLVVLIVGVIGMGHFGLLRYSERYISEEVAFLRRILFILQLIAAGVISTIMKAPLIVDAIYISGCTALFYMIVKRLATRYPKQVNLVFVIIMPLLLLLGIIVALIYTFAYSPEKQSAKQPAERQQQQGKFPKDIETLMKEYDQLQQRQTDSEEFRETTDHTVEK